MLATTSDVDSWCTQLA